MGGSFGHRKLLSYCTFLYHLTILIQLGQGVSLVKGPGLENIAAQEARWLHGRLNHAHQRHGPHDFAAPYKLFKAVPNSKW